MAPTNESHDFWVQEAPKGYHLTEDYQSDRAGSDWGQGGTHHRRGAQYPNYYRGEMRFGIQLANAPWAIGENPSGRLLVVRPRRREASARALGAGTGARNENTVVIEPCGDY